MALANHEATRQKRARQRLCAGEKIERKKNKIFFEEKNNKLKIGRDYGVDSMMRILSQLPIRTWLGSSWTRIQIYMMTMYVPGTIGAPPYCLCVLLFDISFSHSLLLQLYSILPQQLLVFAISPSLTIPTLSSYVNHVAH